MAVISVRRMGLKRELPLELLYNVIDICAQNSSLNDLKALSLVSRSFNRQARKHIWGHIELPTKGAVRLDRDGRDFSFLVDALSTLPDISYHTKSLHLASHPPTVLYPFLRKLKFGRLQRLSIHGYDPRVPFAPSPASLAKLARTNCDIRTLKLSNFRMDPIAFLDLVSQSTLHELRHCTLDVINTTFDDSWDDYLKRPSSEVLDDFIEQRTQTQNVARPSLTSLSLNRITNLPNAAFCSALFRHTHSLFNISSLQRLTLTISSYPPVPLRHFIEVIELCCLSVTSLTIHNWQDVIRSDSTLIAMFVNAIDVTFNVYDGASLDIVKFSMELLLEHLAALKSLKRVKFAVESFKEVNFLSQQIADVLAILCREVPGIEEFEVSIRSSDAEYYKCQQRFVWDRERCAMVCMTH
ncbi:hypothetical protein GGU11DRAFT_168448 [Lentinula aff. detonsa]|nr:hypothetical protein GGU11DRAFT_168448 [Lentinula aff. detonsa]